MLMAKVYEMTLITKIVTGLSVLILIVAIIICNERTPSSLFPVLRVVPVNDVVCNDCFFFNTSQQGNWF